MKKVIISFLLTFIISLSLFSVPKSEVFAREQNTLVVYSWEDYIDLGYEEEDILDLPPALTSRFSKDELLESVLDQFEREQGIKVEYYPFATNEEMYNELKNNPNGVDLICPSEYMIMKMKDEGLIKSFKTPQSWEENGSPYIKSMFEKLGLTDGEEKVYTCGYMWGTMGYIYNADKTSHEELKHWDGVFADKFNGKITIKDSIRDTYIMALGAVYQEELLALDKTDANYNDKVFEIFNRTDDESIKKVEKFLKSLKEKLYGFEVDSGKSDLINGKIDVNFAWSGDAVYTINEGEYAGKNFEYVVPEEGSNVWFDGWVMPNNANEENATKFINFISNWKNVVRNMAYIGYTSCSVSDEIFSYVKDSYEEDGEYLVDVGYLFKGMDYQGSDYLIKTSNLHKQLATQYPDKSVIERCAVMDNFSGYKLDKINEMWNNVKFITFPGWIIILVVVLVLLLLVAVIVYKLRDKIFLRLRRRKKLKIIKKEVIN